MNLRPLGYEPNELPDCSTPRLKLVVYTTFEDPRKFCSGALKKPRSCFRSEAAFGALPPPRVSANAIATSSMAAPACQCSTEPAAARRCLPRAGRGLGNTAAMPDLVTRRPQGLFCEPGGFYIDPWLPVDLAVITHAHADHCRPGHAAYLAQRDALGLMRARLGDEAALEGLA